MGYSKSLLTLKNLIFFQFRILGIRFIPKRYVNADTGIDCPWVPA